MFLSFLFFFSGAMLGTELQQAARAGRSDRVAILMAQHPDSLHTSDQQGWTALHHAAINGHQDIVALIVNYSRQSIHARDFKGRTALALAATYGHESVVKLLCELKPDLTCVLDDSNNTVLHWVLGDTFSAEVVKRIWELNPSALGVVNHFEQTPFDVAVSEGNQQTIEWLQWHLPLEEITRTFIVSRRPLEPVRGLLTRATSSLSPDVVGVVFEYLIPEV